MPDHIRRLMGFTAIATAICMVVAVLAATV
jgi:hypothetical protein